MNSEILKEFVHCLISERASDLERKRFATKAFRRIWQALKNLDRLHVAEKNWWFAYLWGDLGIGDLNDDKIFYELGDRFAVSFMYDPQEYETTAASFIAPGWSKKLNDGAVKIYIGNPKKSDFTKDSEGRKVLTGRAAAECWLDVRVSAIHELIHVYDMMIMNNHQNVRSVTTNRLDKRYTTPDEEKESYFNSEVERNAYMHQAFIEMIDGFQEGDESPEEFAPNAQALWEKFISFVKNHDEGDTILSIAGEPTLRRKMAVRVWEMWQDYVGEY